MAKGIKTGGRQKGSLNKATVDVRLAAQQFGAEAITSLANIMRTSENDAAKISAAKELLDRGYGKSMQPVEMSGPEGEALTLTVNFVTPERTK